MKDITEMRIKDNEDLREIGMHIMQFIFSKSQENLVNPMPWGDEKYPVRDKAHNKPSVISDTSGLLISGVPPYWEDDKIVFRYDSPESVWTEWGTPPHSVSNEGITNIAKWVRRKTKVRDENASFKFAQSIAWKIRKIGMDAHPYIRPAIESARREFKLIEIQTE